MNQEQQLERDLCATEQEVRFWIGDHNVLLLQIEDLKQDLLEEREQYSQELDKNKE